MERLRVLVVHNRYQQYGGEDAVVDAEVQMLRRDGHRVVQYARHSRELEALRRTGKPRLLLNAIWSAESYREVSRVAGGFRPDVAHFHNVNPLISPSAYYACKEAGIAVVQTLHNYRMLCPAGTCFHCGSVCSACRASLLAGVVKGCFRESRVATAAMASVLAVHRLLGTWKRAVNTYIAPSRFCRDFAITNGVPPDQLQVKPHFLNAEIEPREGDGEYAIFAGRLSAEKGIMILLQAWAKLAQIPLVVVGNGPLESEARSLAAKSGAAHIRFTGALPHWQVLALLRRARFVVFPSQCCETFGMSLMEAAACGVPAVASRIGAIPEIVVEGETGLLFEATCIQEMADKVAWGWSHAAEMRRMGDGARRHYLRRYTAERNIPQLLTIYRSAITQNSQLALRNTIAASPATTLKETS